VTRASQREWQLASRELGFSQSNLSPSKVRKALTLSTNPRRDIQLLSFIAALREQDSFQRRPKEQEWDDALIAFSPEMTKDSQSTDSKGFWVSTGEN
jgi:hypothetical protein